VARDARRTWNRITRPVRKLEDGLESFVEDTGRKVNNWQEDPRHELARVLNTTSQGITNLSDNADDFARRKVAELRTDVRSINSALERGNMEAAIGHGAGYLLHFSGLTDVRVTRTILGGMVGGLSQSVQHFNRNREVFLDPSQVGTRQWYGAAGEMAFVGFDIPTMGGFSDIRYGLEEGDLLRVAAGFAQVLPNTGLLDEGLDFLVGGREAYRGWQSGDVARMEVGLFSMGFNALQARGGAHGLLHAMEHPVEYAPRAMRRAGQLAEGIQPEARAVWHAASGYARKLRADEFGHLELRRTSSNAAEMVRRAAAVPPERVTVLGPGSGFHELDPIAKAHPKQEILAVDIDEKAIEGIKHRIEKGLLPESIIPIHADYTKPEVIERIRAEKVINLAPRTLDVPKAGENVYNVLLPGGRGYIATELSHESQKVKDLLISLQESEIPFEGPYGITRMEYRRGNRIGIPDLWSEHFWDAVNYTVTEILIQRFR
jgi:hypothetical protein